MFNNSMSVYLTFGSKHVFVHLWKNSLWTWLHVYERGSPSSLLASNTVFLVYYPNAEYIFMSTIKAAHKQYILQVKEYNIDKQLSKFIILLQPNTWSFQKFNIFLLFPLTYCILNGLSLQLLYSCTCSWQKFACI